MWNRSSESEHTCLVPDLRKIAFRFSPWNVMLAVGLWYTAFVMLRYIPLYPIYWEFFFFLIINEFWIFVKHFFLHLLKLSHVSSSVNVVCFIDWFPDVESFLNLWNSLIMVNSVFFRCIAELSLLILCWGFFTYVHQIYWPVIFFVFVFRVKTQLQIFLKQKNMRENKVNRNQEQVWRIVLIAT